MSFVVTPAPYQGHLETLHQFFGPTMKVPFVADSWYHVAGTWDAAERRVFNLTLSSLYNSDADKLILERNISEHSSP